MKTLVIVLSLLACGCSRHFRKDVRNLEEDFDKNLEKDIEAYVVNFENELSYLDHYNYGNPTPRPGRLIQDISIRYYIPDNIEIFDKFDTSNGIHVSQEGEIKDPGTEKEHLETKGEYSYVAPNGVLYSVSYTAGENGFRPVFRAERVRPE